VEDWAKRTATIETVESCDLLCLSREKFQEIFLDLIEKDLNERLSVLSLLPFLRVLICILLYTDGF